MNEARTIAVVQPARSLVFHVCGRPGLNDRPALPPGHPTTWGLLIAGTELEGADYPFPVFDP